jgi:hypothetical protein
VEPLPLSLTEAYLSVAAAHVDTITKRTIGMPSFNWSFRALADKFHLVTMAAWLDIACNMNVNWMSFTAYMRDFKLSSS